jgi:hypothetical protein
MERLDGSQTDLVGIHANAIEGLGGPSRFVSMPPAYRWPATVPVQVAPPHKGRGQASLQGRVPDIAPQIPRMLLRSRVQELQYLYLRYLQLQIWPVQQLRDWRIGLSGRV